MGVLAFITSILGGLCAIMGIITAALGGPILVAGFTMFFWFTLAGISLVAAIFCLVAIGRYE